jgi:diguanylate cyclase (GGDEF)-like protein
MSLFIGVYTLFRSQSHKKNYFLLVQAMIIVYLLGYLLELVSTNTEEAYVGAKVLYTSAPFIATFLFFFITDYCDIKIHTGFIKIPMLIVSLATALILWVNKYHYLVYWDYSYSVSLAQHINFTPGPLYFMLHSYPIVCMILVMAAILYRLKKWKRRYRRQLFVLLVCLVIPFITEGIYFTTVITGLNVDHVYLTPYFIAVMNFCLYLGVVRFNIFEISSMATISAMEYIREGFVLVDDASNYLLSNPVAEKIIPGLAKLVKGESISSARGWPRELVEPGTGPVEFSIIDRGTRYFRASVSPVFTQSRTLIARIILFGDITDNVELMKKLENAAYIDGLTGLYNRKHFSELAINDIERAQRLNQSIYTAMLDLDFFKQVNDNYGHAAGDLVLMKTAVIIRKAIRSYDLLCRYGGEEFVFLITDLDDSEAHNQMERIRENMENCVTIYEGVVINITCSIGLAKFTDGDDLETSIKKADVALYAAKNAGRNQIKIFESWREFHTPHT